MKKQHARSFTKEVAIIAVGILIGARVAAPLWEGVGSTDLGVAALVPQWTAQVIADPLFLPDLQLDSAE